MVTVLLRLLFWTVNTLARVVSLAVFRTVAFLVVQLIHAVRVPASIVNLVADQVSALFRSGMEQLVDLLKDAVLSLATNAFNLSATAASGSAFLTTYAVGWLAETITGITEELWKIGEILLQALEGFQHMAAKMAGDLWSNYEAAVDYVIKNV